MTFSPTAIFATSGGLPHLRFLRGGRRKPAGRPPDRPRARVNGRGTRAARVGGPGGDARRSMTVTTEPCIAPDIKVFPSASRRLLGPLRARIRPNEPGTIYDLNNSSDIIENAKSHKRHIAVPAREYRWPARVVRPRGEFPGRAANVSRVCRPSRPVPLYVRSGRCLTYRNRRLGPSTRRASGFFEGNRCESTLPLPRIPFPTFCEVSPSSPKSGEKATAG